MKTESQIKEYLRALDLPSTADAMAANQERMRWTEQELRRAVTSTERDPDLMSWLNAWTPLPGGCGHIVYQKAMSRATTEVGKFRVDGCLGFCPVTLVIGSAERELPPFNLDLFRNPHPEIIVSALEAHGLADDYSVDVDPQLYPLNQIALLKRTALPELVRSMADAATLSKVVSGRHHPVMQASDESVAGSASIAGMKIIGSFLIPVIYYGEAMRATPAAMAGRLANENIAAFEAQVSQELTTAMDGRSRLSIQTIVSRPRLILSALYESMTAHCGTSAFWTARDAIQNGVTECSIICTNTANGEGVAIGFDAGPASEHNFFATATTQAEIDRYTASYINGAKAAGMQKINYLTYDTFPENIDDHGSNNQSRTYN